MTKIVDIQIACEEKGLPSEHDFQQWVDAALIDVTEDCELSIRLVEVNESSELNSTYRGKSGPTNVLSFPFDTAVELTPRLLGDLVICRNVVEDEAREQQKKVVDHWAHLVVHGCLHLLGYDHIQTEEAEQMEALEVKILQTMNIENPYFEQESKQ
jgi:probable rRNA maturation factor